MAHHLNSYLAGEYYTFESPTNATALANPGNIPLFSALGASHPVLDTLYKTITTDESAKKYINKSAIKDALISEFYANMTPAQDNKLYGIMLDGLQAIKTRLHVPAKDIDFALKGGGACRFYTEQFYNRINDVSKVASIRRLYQEKISDIDVGLVYHNMDRKSAERITYHALNFIRFNYHNDILQICNTIFTPRTLAHKSFLDKYGSGGTEEVKFVHMFNSYIGESKDSATVIDDVKLNTELKHDAVTYRENDTNYTVTTNRIILDPVFPDPDGTGGVIPGTTISYANLMEVCSPQQLKFMLYRYKVYFDIHYTKADGTTGKESFPIEIYDIGLSSNDMTNFFKSNGLEKPDVGTKPVLDYNLIAPGANAAGVVAAPSLLIPSVLEPRGYYDRIVVYSLKFIIDDLINMLFQQPPYPNVNKKYAKRIVRLMNVLLINELDKNNLDDTENMAGTFVQHIQAIGDVDINKLDDDVEPVSITLPDGTTDYNKNVPGIGQSYLRQKITACLSTRDMFYHMNSHLYKVMDAFLNILCLIMYINVNNKITKMAIEKSMRAGMSGTITYDEKEQYDPKSVFNGMLKVEWDFITTEIIDHEWSYRSVCTDKNLKTALYKKEMFIADSVYKDKYLEDLVSYFNDFKKTVGDNLNGIMIRMIQNIR